MTQDKTPTKVELLNDLKIIGKQVKLFGDTEIAAYSRLKAAIEAQPEALGCPAEYKGPFFAYDFMPQKIMFKSGHGDDTMALDVLSVRGWGYLTGGGHAALGLNQTAAVAIQDNFGNWVVATLNAALTVPEAQPEAVGEPVAWRLTSPMGHIDYYDNAEAADFKKRMAFNGAATVEPLYLRPSPPQAVTVPAGWRDALEVLHSFARRPNDANFSGSQILANHNAEMGAHMRTIADAFSALPPAPQQELSSSRVSQTTDAAAETRPQAEADPVWPDGCYKPSSCSRHRHCVYTKCVHENADITAQVDAVLSAPQQGGE